MLYVANIDIKLGLCLGWKGLWIRSVTRGREGEVYIQGLNYIPHQYQ